MAASNGLFQLRSRPGIFNKDNVYALDNRAVAMHLQPHVPQHWVPDERDNFISWLRSEFAAANAIIDAFCHHLRLIGNAGEYDLVFACLQQRRYNWNGVLHLQQYFSVADIMVALQQVAQKNQHVLGADPIAIQNVDGIGLRSSAVVHGVHEHKQQSLSTRTIEQTIAKERSSETVVPPKDDSDKGKHQVGHDGKGNYPATPEPTRHPFVSQNLVEYKVPQIVVRNNQPPLQATSSSSPPLASHGQKSSEWRKRNSQNRFGLTSKKREGYRSKSSNDLKFFSKPDEDARFAAIKASKQLLYREDVEGQTINVVEGLELYESVFNNEESSRLELLVADLNSAEKPSENDNKDISDVIPAPLQVLIDRLVRWHIIPYNKRPDSCTFMILEKGDSAIVDFNSVDLAQPVFLISLLSECSLVPSSKSPEAGNVTDIKDPLKLFLPVGSVLVLQGNSAKVAVHTLSAISEKCCQIILGKTAAKKGSQSGSPTAPKPADSFSATEVDASHLPGAKWAVHSGKTQAPSNMQNVGAAASGILPLRLTIPSGQTLAELHKPTLQPLLPATASHQVGPFSPGTVMVPGWSPMPKIVRTSSSGTGVFLPSNTSSTGPGRPPYTNLQRRQGILTPPTSMQRTASSPAFFPSSNGDFYQASSSISPALFQSNSQPSVGTLQPAEAASNSYLLPSPVHKVPLSESSSSLQSTDFTLNSRD